MTTIIKITMFLKKKNEIEQLTKELETLKADIITDMNGKEEITCGQYKVTNKDCTRTDIDKKALKEKYPAIAKELETTTTYKRFIAK